VKISVELPTNLNYSNSSSKFALILYSTVSLFLLILIGAILVFSNMSLWNQQSQKQSQIQQSRGENRQVQGQGSWWDPLHSMEHALDTFFDDNHSVRVRDHAAQLKIDPQGGFTYKINTQGFKPDELNVDLDGEQLIVSGKHMESSQNEQVVRNFERRVMLPATVDKSTIHCDLDQEGRLIVEGASPNALEAPQDLRRQLQIPMRRQGDNTSTESVDGSVQSAEDQRATKEPII